MSCIDMHTWMLMAWIELLSHGMWLRSTISTLVMIMNMTHYSFNIALPWFLNHKKNHISFTKHWIWSNGCVGSFKSTRNFYWLSWLHKDTQIQHTWNFFEIGHGNGEDDGASACVKQELRRYQMSHDVDRLKSSTKVVNWCKFHLGHEENEKMRSMHRLF